MITCTLRYEIDPAQLEAFEVYGKACIHLVEKLGGTHHGYHLPHEGPNDIAYAHFSFPSLADYEIYREKMKADPDCIRAFDHAKRTNCIRRFDRSFTKPVLTGATVDELGL